MRSSSCTLQTLPCGVATGHSGDRYAPGAAGRPTSVRTGLIDLGVTDEAAVDQPGVGRLTATFADLLDHRHHLPLIRSGRRHLDAHDHQRIDVASQLRVVSRPKPLHVILLMARGDGDIGALHGDAAVLHVGPIVSGNSCLAAGRMQPGEHGWPSRTVT